MGSGEASVGKTGAVSHRLKRKLMIAIVKERQIDSEIHVGGTGGVGRACTWARLLMTTVCQTCTGRHEGSHRAGSRLGNFRRDEGHGAVQ